MLLYYLFLMQFIQFASGNLTLQKFVFKFFRQWHEMYSVTLFLPRAFYSFYQRMLLLILFSSISAIACDVFCHIICSSFSLFDLI